jgi:aminopeptidase N
VRNIKSLPLFFLSIAFIVASPSLTGAQTSPPNFNYRIHSHSLTLEIRPAEHYLLAEDRFEIHLKVNKATPFAFLLHPDLKIKRILNLESGKPIPWIETPFSKDARRFDILLKNIKRSLLLSVSYEGRIYDPIVKEKALQFVRGDQTSGLISEEGVYLAASSHWYPDRPDSMASFRVHAKIPEPFRVITQGERLSEERKSGLWESRWFNPLPAEGLTLVAGKYSVQTRKVNDILVSTYFFPEDDRLSEIFLNAAEEYLSIYSGLLGPYPYKKFDIVQNFFSTGYGIPTFTLLSPDAIRQGKEFLRPGALDHEIVHSWWGHAVSVKLGTGNWVEALTSYCTNYFYKELKMGEEAARKHRQDILQKYAIQVSPSKDHPLRRFEGKEDEAGAQVGYGKGSMVFHMLRMLVGKDLFFETLRRFAVTYRGKQAAWTDIQDVFEKADGRKLDGFFSQWLDRPGGPRLRLEDIHYQITDKGYRISGEVVQEGEGYELSVVLRIDDGVEVKTLPLDTLVPRTLFSIEVPRIPVKVDIDPDAHLFRKLDPGEILPCLNAFLEEDKKIFILPGQGDEESREIYRTLAQMALDKKGGKLLFTKDVREEDIVNSSLMLLGESYREPIFSKLLSKLPHPIVHKEGSFWINGKKVGAEDESFLITFPHPLSPGRWVTLFFGLSSASLSRARYVFFYGWDSYLLFRNGRPIERGRFSPKATPASVDFLSQQFNQIDAQRLRNHLSHLASRDMGGRLPGTPGYRKAQAYLIDRLMEIGMTPIYQPFSFSVKDVSEAKLVITTPEGEKELKAAPGNFSGEGEWEGPGILFDDQEMSQEEQIDGKAVLLYSETGEEEESFLEKIMDLQTRGASAIVFFVRKDDLNSLSPYITYPSSFPPMVDEGVKSDEREGHGMNRWVEASKVAARGEEIDFSVEIPVLFVSLSTDESKWLEDLKEEKEISVRLSLRFKETPFQDLNLGGVIEGKDPAKKGEFLILGAHYDHLGQDEKSGAFYPGADDNGSGVSALLEIARVLKEKEKDLKRSLLVLFLGGEEWGLRGSRTFLERPFIPLEQVEAIFSLDSIGGKTDGREVSLTGAADHTALLERNQKFLAPLSLKEGRGMNRFHSADETGHPPFSQAGVSFLNYFASSNRKLHTFRDQIESIDFEKLTDIATLIYLVTYEFLTEP